SNANGQRALELRATLEHGKVRQFVDPTAFEDFRQTVERAIPELEQLGDDASLAKGWGMVAQVHLMALESGAMDKALERSIEHARRAGYRSQEIDATMWLLRTSWFGPRPVEDGLRLCDEVLAQSGLEPGLKSV